ncbi:unnamed protein product [Ectocarpus sp. CCAP 1310/34]|nr:unnamed protein product [Ectocarpus sp. CCAP 1310/34]
MLHSSECKGGGSADSANSSASGKKSLEGTVSLPSINPTSRNMLMSMIGNSSWEKRGLISISRKSVSSTAGGDTIEDDSTAAVITG